MKKTVYLLITLILLILLSSCGTNKPYLKEISFVPSYISTMKLDSSSKQNSNGIISATYIVKNTTAEDVLVNYENILKNNGWTITQETLPTSITANKDSHSIALVPTQVSKDVKLYIIAK